MTEEIIIDGVNVSECKYLNKVVNEEPYCNIDEEHLYTCSSNENCYYKQLKRLEQENETTNKDLLTERQENAELATENHNLRKALETIREILNVKCSIVSNAECVGIINEVLDESN